jgi:hypothetical protein
MRDIVAFPLEWPPRAGRGAAVEADAPSIAACFRDFRRNVLIAAGAALHWGTRRDFCGNGNEANPENRRDICALSP